MLLSLRTSLKMPLPAGYNWKSNANSILPRAVFVRAVQEASDEANTRDASTYGKLVNLIIEKSLSQRAEMQRLEAALNDVLDLFRPSEDNPERQATEIRELQGRINASLSQVVAGQAIFRTEAPDLRSMVMPSTSLVIRDEQSGISTEVAYQGHGLQRTLIITLLQELADAQAKAGADAADSRSTILLVEESELYLHPQMERLMRDVLRKLSTQPSTQVACCTHSPAFIDVAYDYRSIVRLIKSNQGDATVKQVTNDIFLGDERQVEKAQLQTVARFDSSVNELFFAKSVVLTEEFSAIAAFEHAASLLGYFTRHPRLRREVTFVDCNGKHNIVPFLRVLNEFGIDYRVIYDTDDGKPIADQNESIRSTAAQFNALAHGLTPDLEGVLGYQPPSKAKPYAAVRQVTALHENGELPDVFIRAVCLAYFGQTTEPAP